MKKIYTLVLKSPRLKEQGNTVTIIKLICTVCIRKEVATLRRYRWNVDDKGMKQANTWSDVQKRTQATLDPVNASEATVKSQHYIIKMNLCKYKLHSSQTLNVDNSERERKYAFVIFFFILCYLSSYSTIFLFIYIIFCTRCRFNKKIYIYS